MAGNKRLYTLIIPEDSLSDTQSSRQRELAKQGLVNNPGQAVESISLDPGERRLQGAYRGLFADEMASELRELAEASDITTVPFFDDDTQSPDDGYYAIDSANVQPADPRFQNVQPWTLRLTKSGTRRDSWRLVDYTRDSGDNPFSDAGSVFVDLAEEATKIRWFNTETNETQPASPDAQLSLEPGVIQRFNAFAGPYTDTQRALIYSVPYDVEGEYDVTVWDDHDRADRTDADGVLQYQHVFDPGHEFDGAAIFDTGRFRLTVDDDAQTMSAEKWDIGTTSWTTVSLGSSSWQVYDTDIISIGAREVAVQFIFEDSTDGSQHTLDGLFQAVAPHVVFLTPQNETGSLPAGLETYLDPIAFAGSEYSRQSRGLVARREVRK